MTKQKYVYFSITIIINAQRRKWQPTPAFFLGEFHGQRSLVGYSPWGCKESDATEAILHACMIISLPILSLFSFIVVSIGSRVEIESILIPSVYIYILPCRFLLISQHFPYEFIHVEVNVDFHRDPQIAQLVQLKTSHLLRLQMILQDILGPQHIEKTFLYKVGEQRESCLLVQSAASPPGRSTARTPGQKQQVCLPTHGMHTSEGHVRS